MTFGTIGLVLIIQFVLMQFHTTPTPFREPILAAIRTWIIEDAHGSMVQFYANDPSAAAAYIGQQMDLIKPLKWREAFDVRILILVDKKDDILAFDCAGQETNVDYETIVGWSECPDLNHLRNGLKSPNFEILNTLIGKAAVQH